MGNDTIRFTTYTCPGCGGVVRPLLLDVDAIEAEDDEGRVHCWHRECWLKALEDKE